MVKTIKGIAASDGIATAEAYLLVQPDLSFTKKSVSDADSEVSRLKDAISTSDDELTKIRDIAKESLGEEEAQVFDAHKMILADPEFTGAVEKEVTDNKVNAEQALHDVSENFISIFEGMTDNPYMQERAADVRDVTKRVMAHLLGVTLPNPALIDHDVVIVAHDLTPSDTAQLSSYVKGFVTDIGGRTAHSAIMARSLELPAVVGTDTITKDVKDGDKVIIDGLNGAAIVDPSDEDIKNYTQKAREFAAEKAV